jgi:hypothetical protein
MKRDELLETYIQDHRAAATGGIELVERMYRENRDNDLGNEMRRILTELEEERDTIDRIMETMQIRHSATKQAAQWFGEKFARLKPNNQLTGYSPLSRVLELEALTAGVMARQGLWRALQVAVQYYPELEKFDLERYEKRTHEQLDRLTRLHERFSEPAFGPQASP